MQVLVRNFHRRLHSGSCKNRLLESFSLLIEFIAKLDEKIRKQSSILLLKKVFLSAREHRRLTLLSSDICSARKPRERIFDGVIDTYLITVCVMVNLAEASEYFLSFLPLTFPVHSQISQFPEPFWLQTLKHSSANFLLFSVMQHRNAVKWLRARIGESLSIVRSGFAGIRKRTEKHSSLVFDFILLKIFSSLRFSVNA